MSAETFDTIGRAAARKAKRDAATIAEDTHVRVARQHLANARDVLRRDHARDNGNAYAFDIGGLKALIQLATAALDAAARTETPPSAFERSSCYTPAQADAAVKEANDERHARERARAAAERR